MDRGAWRATVRGMAKSWTQLSNFDFPLIPLISFLTSQEPIVIQTFRRLWGFSGPPQTLSLIISNAVLSSFSIPLGPFTLTQPTILINITTVTLPPCLSPFQWTISIFIIFLTIITCLAPNICLQCSPCFCLMFKFTFPGFEAISLQFFYVFLPILQS